MRREIWKKEAKTQMSAFQSMAAAGIKARELQDSKQVQTACAAGDKITGQPIVRALLWHVDGGHWVVLRDSETLVTAAPRE
jgi:hypothetical protein